MRFPCGDAILLAGLGTGAERSEHTIMQEMTEQEILDSIAGATAFHALIEGGAFEVKVDHYVPCIGTAIHAGHRLRPALLNNCLLDDDARLLEEDPFTDQFIADFPITLIARDSRYEYDLNRGPDNAVYDTAWGVEVWRTPLSHEQRQEALAKHAQFYRVMQALARRVEQECGGCMIVDTHSYNHQVREYDAPPVFNIGTEQVDEPRWQTVLDIFDRQLRAITLPGEAASLGWNAVFYGRGYQATVAREHLEKTLVVPLEVKKIFMNEMTGEPLPEQIQAIREGFKQLLSEAEKVFQREYCTGT